MMFFEQILTFFRLNKLTRIYCQILKLYQKKRKNLDSCSQEILERGLKDLQQALVMKNVVSAASIAKHLKVTADTLLTKTFLEKIRDSGISLAVALLIAIVIRTMWFEPYTIPTGSMRPTLKEGDLLVVSKTDYGLNVPLTPAHFYFDPELIQRGSIFVFSGDHLNIADPYTTYFYLFPGKKLFVKRLLGKPGDTLYFYGGKLYGVDREGRPLTEFQTSDWASHLEHIPFIRFEGKIEGKGSKPGLSDTVFFYQMNQKVAELSINPLGGVSAKMIASNLGKPLSQYSELWGFKNYAMARLLNQEDLKKLYPYAMRDLDPHVPLYLELLHHPSLQDSKLIQDERRQVRPGLGYSTSLFPLSEKHIQKIKEHMTTCRFVVKDGVAYRYGMTVNKANPAYFPKLPQVPDGTYEIQNGKASEILWGGIASELKVDHPLYSSDPAQIQLLYNLGIEFATHYMPDKPTAPFPSRYAYFRNEELCLLNAPIVDKNDPEMRWFVQRELDKRSISTSIRPYLPFVDEGAPVKEDGTLDRRFIYEYGLTIPDGMYLALGDNHAMSGDSREFGFVPEDNIRGTPSFLFWPVGDRLGRLSQPSYPFASFPNLFVWMTALSIAVASLFYFQKKLKEPLKFK
jgi:signal peptidase I